MKKRFKVRFKSSYDGVWHEYVMSETWDNIFVKAGGAQNVYDYVDKLANRDETLYLWTTPHISVNDEVVWEKNKGYSEEWSKQRVIFELSRKI